MSFGSRGKKILGLLEKEKHADLLEVENPEDTSSNNNLSDINGESKIENPEFSSDVHIDNVMNDDLQNVNIIISEDLQNMDAVIIIEDLRNVQPDSSPLLLCNYDAIGNTSNFNDYINDKNEFSALLEQNVNDQHTTDNVGDLVSNAVIIDDECRGHDVTLPNESDANSYEKHNDDTSEEQNDNDNEYQEHEVNHNNNIMEGRKRSLNAQPDKWKKNVAKKRRMEGKSYLGYSRSHEGNVTHKTPRAARKMGASCRSRECLRIKSKKCSEITEDQRKELFENFWGSLNWDQRKIFVINYVEKKSPKRKYTKNNESRRRYSFSYFLTVNNEKMQVCKKMFLQTLALGEYSVHDWIQKGNNCGMTSCSDVKNKMNKPSIRQDKNKDKEFLKEFFNSLPKLPSHYGRLNSTKLYLETTIHSLIQLFKLYQERCQAENKSALSRTVFNNMFYSMNLSIHPIKKDKCDMCTQHEIGQLSDEAWNTHRLKKEKARTEKAKDKEDAKTNQRGRVLTIDLQAVKVCPYVQASAIFFKLKLCCHNFTVYDTVTHKAKCFWFTEIDADMTASTFVSCIMEYLSTDCQNETGPIIIYSDGCTYQNRNNILSNALLNYAVENQIEIIQKFLEVGHTQMECDSVHSCIERKLKRHDIHLPSDYIRITQEARTKPFPYEIKCMQYFDFKDYTVKKYQRYASIRPGKVVHDPVVTDLKAIKYSPDEFIYYKLDFDEDWKKLPQRQKHVTEVVVWPQMNKQKRNIKHQKWQHLQQLKSVIPTDCHSFYDNLQYDNN